MQILWKKKLPWLPPLLNRCTLLKTAVTIVKHGPIVKSILLWFWAFVLQLFLSLIITNLLGIPIKVLWVNKLWEFTSPISMWEWTLWLMFYITHKNPWLQREGMYTILNFICLYDLTIKWNPVMVTQHISLYAISRPRQFKVRTDL